MDKCKLKDTVLVSFLVVSAALPVLPIGRYYYEFSVKNGIYDNDMFYRFLGKAREIFSTSAYINTDIYFHGGVYKLNRGECRYTRGVKNKPQDTEHGQTAGHGDFRPEEKEKHISGTRRWNILPFLAETVRISRHIHLEGKEEKELLPWYYYAVRLNRNNIDAYVLGGWTAWNRLNMPDEGVKFLKEGLSFNPASWKINLELGRLYSESKKDFRHALIYLHAADKLLTDNNSDRYDKRRVYTFAAYCHEKLGQTEKASRYYKKIIALFPDNNEALKKIVSLSSKSQ